MSLIPQVQGAIAGAQVKTRKKLIEVALPLEAINKACVKEGSPFTPRHPRSLAVWWARRRLAAARAVIFSQMVDDPSAYVDVLRADPKLQRKLRVVDSRVADSVK